MQEPLHNYMRLGIVHFVAYPCQSGEGPIVETVRAICADPDFETIEITWIHDPQVKAQVAEMLAVSGMKVCYCAHPWLLNQGLDLNAADEGARLTAVEAVYRAIDDAASYGIDGISVVSGAFTGEADKAAALERLADSLIRISRYANERTISVVLEVFDQTIDKKRLVGKAADAKHIAEQVTAVCSNFGLMIDLSHLPLLGETPAEALQPVAPYVRHVHLGNCYMKDRNDPAWGDLHPYFGYPGSEVDEALMAEFLQELFAIGYLRPQANPRPIVSFEMKPAPHESPELVIAGAKRTLKAAWARVVIPDGDADPV